MAEIQRREEEKREEKRRKEIAKLVCVCVCPASYKNITLIDTVSFYLLFELVYTGET